MPVTNKDLPTTLLLLNPLPIVAYRGDTSLQVAAGAQVDVSKIHPVYTVNGKVYIAESFHRDTDAPFYKSTNSQLHIEFRIYTTSGIIQANIIQGALLYVNTDNITISNLAFEESDKRVQVSSDNIITDDDKTD